MPPMGMPAGFVEGFRPAAAPGAMHMPIGASNANNNFGVGGGSGSGKRKDDEEGGGDNDSAKRVKLQPSQIQLSMTSTANGTGSVLAGVSGIPVQRPQISSQRSYCLYVDSDERNLSQYQCLARKQIEIFEATEEESQSNAQGRNRPVMPGQVGIRCRHCSNLPSKQRKTGSVYYPNRVSVGLESWGVP
jgi:hypothetical protein